jgi:putative peptide zinc metalloprotease protein
VRADQDGTLASFAAFVAAPVPSARPDAAAFARPIHLSPGPHLAVSMIPVGGATKEHPAMFFIAGDDGQPAVAILSDSVPDAAAMRTQTAAQTQQPAAVTTTATTTTSAAAASTTTASTAPPQVVGATAFPFKLPDKPKPGDTQALAVGTKDGGVTYNIAYSLVTVHDGADVTNQNSAYALASCKGCTTVAVSFQVVLIVGTSKKIAPINVAEALNGNCPACVTTAIADQIVVTLDKEPTPELLQKIEAALHQLDAIAALGKNASPAAVAAAVAAVQKQIDDAIAESGLASNKAATTTTATTTTATTTTSPTQTATTTSTTTPAATTTATTTAQATTTTTTRAQTTATTTTTGAATTAVTTTTADTTTTATTPTATTTR